MDIISMVKHAASEEAPLLTAEERVRQAFEKLAAGRKSTQKPFAANSRRPKPNSPAAKGAITSRLQSCWNASNRSAPDTRRDGKRQPGRSRGAHGWRAAQNRVCDVEWPIRSVDSKIEHIKTMRSEEFLSTSIFQSWLKSFSSLL
jgi:hypothetical protein